MKKYLFIKISFCLFVVLLTSNFISCKNFLNGKDIRQEIDSQIEYALKTPVTIRLTGDTTLVNFLSGSGDFSLKDGDSRTVDFSIINPAYRFIGWQVVEKENPAIDGSSYLEITVNQSDDQISTVFKLKDKCPDLVVAPVITRKPAIEKSLPENTEDGVSYLSSVRIKFTQAIQKETAVMDNIKIVDSLGENVSKLYKIGSLSDDGLYLTLVPDIEKIKKYFSEKTTLTFYLSENIKEEAAPFAGLYNGLFQITIIALPDETDPVFLSHEIYKQKHYLKENGLLKIDSKDFNQWTNDDFLLLNVRDRIFIKNLTAFDEGSGIKSLYIQETVVKTDVQNGAENTKTDIFEYSDFTDNGVSSVFNDFEYVLRSSADGIIKVDLWLEDLTGRKSEHLLYYVFKFADGINAINLNRGLGLRFPDANGKDVITNKEIQSIECYEKVFGDITIPLKVKLIAKDELTAEETVIFEKENFNQSQKYDLPDTLKYERNPYTKTTVTLYAEDGFGYSKKQDYIIPAAVLPSYHGSYRTVFFPNNYSNNYSIDNYWKKLNDKSSEWKIVEFSSDWGCPTIEVFDNFTEIEINSVVKEEFYSCAGFPVRLNIKENFSSVVNNTSNFVYPEIELTATNPGVNKGYQDVKVKYLKPGDTNFKYILYSEVKLKNESEKVFYFEDTFQAPVNGTKLEIKIARFDQYNFILGTSDAEIRKTYVIDVEDNTPPESGFYDWGYFGGMEVYDLAISNTTYNTIRFELEEPFIDDSGLERDPVTNDYVLHYYYVKNSIDNVMEEYSDEKLKEEQSGKLYYKENLYKDVQLNVKEPGTYTVFVKIYDTKGNYYLQTTNFSSYIDEELPKSITYNTSTKKLEGAYNDTSEIRNWYIAKIVKNGSSWNWEKLSSYNVRNLQNYTLDDTAINSFVRIDYAFEKNGIKNFRSASYVYPAFLDGTHTIETKNIMELPYGYQLFIDQPALVQVYYDYSDNEENIGLWSTRGTAIPIKIVGKLDTNASYTINVDEASLEIPNEMYYCTIIHFADGTALKLPTKYR